MTNLTPSGTDSAIADAIREALGLKTAEDDQLFLDLIGDLRHDGSLSGPFHGVQGALDRLRSRKDAATKVRSDATSNTASFTFNANVYPDYNLGITSTDVLQRLTALMGIDAEEWWRIRNLVSTETCDLLEVRQVRWEGKSSLTLEEVRNAAFTSGRETHALASLSWLANALRAPQGLPPGTYLVLPATSEENIGFLVTITPDRKRFISFQDQTQYFLQTLRHAGPRDVFIITTAPTSD